MFVKPNRNDLYEKATLALGKLADQKSAIVAVQKYTLESAKYKNAILLINSITLRTAMPANPERNLWRKRMCLGKQEPTLSGKMPLSSNCINGFHKGSTPSTPASLGGISGSELGFYSVTKAGVIILT